MEHKEAVLDQIREAFRGVVLGNGVGLLEGNAIDDYQDELTRRAYRERDEKLDWTAIPVDVLNKCQSCLHYLDPEGMRFLLPAFIVATLNGEAWDDPVFVLTQVADYEKFALFSPTQRKAVRSYLLLVKDDPNYEYDRPHIDLSLEAFWKVT